MKMSFEEYLKLLEKWREKEEKKGNEKLEMGYGENEQENIEYL